MSSYPVVVNGDTSSQFNRLIAEYLQANDLSAEHENVMRDTVIQMLVLRGMGAQKAIQQGELLAVFRASAAHISGALLYRQELLANPALDDGSRDYLAAFTQETLGVVASNLKRSLETFGETTAEIAERRPNPRSEPLRARIAPAALPALPPPRPITVRPAGWLEKLGRQTFIIEE